MPESKKLAHNPEKIIQEVCHYYHVNYEDLLKTKRGWFNKPRNVAIYLIRFLCNEQLSLIADRFDMNTYSAISNVIQRVGVLRKKDKEMNTEIDILIKRIDKSQMKI